MIIFMPFSSFYYAVGGAAVSSVWYFLRGPTAPLEVSCNTDSEVLNLLGAQLDRCGHSNLVPACPDCVCESANFPITSVGIILLLFPLVVIALAFGRFSVVCSIVSPTSSSSRRPRLDEDDAYGLDEAPRLEDVPRWIPPATSAVRRI